MKSLVSLALGFLSLAGLAQAHMEMIYPPPFRSKANPFAAGDVDYSMTAPLDAGGSNFPCKGYHSLFGTDKGKPVASWAAGQTYNMTITGGANHNGGSCQASLSFDKGATWKVIHSYVGDCPAAGTSSYDFTVPADTPSGDAIFAWTWFNKVGNREMYMNCAAITVSGGSKKRANALSARPGLFVANVNNGCKTTEGTDVAFPNPGPDTDEASSKTSPPVGSCAASDGGAGGGNAGGGNGNNGGGNGNNGNNGGGSGDGGNSGTPSSSVVSNPGSPPTSVANPGIPTKSQPVASPPTSVVNNPGIPTTSKPVAAPTSTAQDKPATSKPATSKPAGGESSTIPGGVFITVSDPVQATSAPVAPPVSSNPPARSSTLLTITRSAGGDTGASPTPPPSTPTGNPTAPKPTAVPTPGGGAGTQQTPGSTCSNEGQWNCVGGTQFQRCASGQWSVMMAVAPGTTCSNDSSNLGVMNIARLKKRDTFRPHLGRSRARAAQAQARAHGHWHASH